MQASLTKNALLLAVIAAICGGSVPVVAKIALEVFEPFTLVFIRFFFASLVLLPFILYTVELNLSSFKRFFLIALMGAVNPILLFVALPSTQASVSPLI